jgi:hypothetical protein
MDSSAHTTALTVPMAEGRRATQILREVAARTPDDQPIRLGEILDAFGERAFGIVLILFSLPNCVPSPPGVGTIFGIPILLFAVQMALGRAKPWLPRFLLRREIRKIDLMRLLDRAEPKLAAIERLCRPRMTHLFTPRIERAIGVYIFILGISVIMPMPLSNFLPAVATVLLALGLFEEDGWLVVIGALVGLVGLGVAIGIFVLAAEIITSGLHQMLGW